MSIRKISFVPGEYYHIYNRGNSKQKIFLDKKDHERFLNLLFLCNCHKNINFRDVFEGNDDLFSFDRGNTLVEIGAYCLMPNHFHLLIKEKEDGHTSLFMQKLATAYVMYFNQKYERSGSLFEGKFKSQHVDSDPYLKYIFSYIHLNPVKIIDPNWKKVPLKDKNEAYDFCKKYEYSSLSYFLKKRTTEQKFILNPSTFPRYFNSFQGQKVEIFEWLDFPLGKA